jgi:hypothetical protein
MRTWTIPLLALLLGGCAASSEPQNGVPLTWRGAFDGTLSTPGHIALLLDEAGPDTWTGTMYFEADEGDGNMPRVTYRIEGTREEGAVHVVQKEILEADPLGYGRSWCLGRYDLSLADEAEGSSLSGSYSEPAGRCAGTTALRPADTL